MSLQSKYKIKFTEVFKGTHKTILKNIYLFI